MKPWTPTRLLLLTAGMIGLATTGLTGCAKKISLQVQPVGQLFVYAQKGDVITWNSDVTFTYGVSPCKANEGPPYRKCTSTKATGTYLYECVGCTDAGITYGPSNHFSAFAGKLATTKTVLGSTTPAVACVNGAAMTADMIDIARSSANGSNPSFIEWFFVGDPTGFSVAFQDASVCSNYDPSTHTCAVSPTATVGAAYPFTVTVNAGSCTGQSVMGNIFPQ